MLDQEASNLRPTGHSLTLEASVATFHPYDSPTVPAPPLDCWAGTQVLTHLDDIHPAIQRKATLTCLGTETRSLGSEPVMPLDRRV